MRKWITYTGIAFALLAVALLLFINQGLASLGEAVYPGSGLWLFGGAIVVEALAFVWFWRGVFGRRPHLVFPGNPSVEEQDRFAREFVRRLRRNPLVSDLDPEAPDYVEKCMVVLKEKADKEIRRTAERIFVATALSQNGRIDALIVFVTLCRLVWRISGIYNQRPHPREITSLYAAVISSTFIALSFEELDIATEITVGFGEAFHAMAPAAMTGSMPFVGSALQKFTSSTIDGAANCFLVLRTGIITRNAYMFAAEEERNPSRTAVYKEAGGILLAMSGNLIDQFTRALSRKLWGMGKKAQDKTVNAGRSLAGGVAKIGGGIGAGVADGVSAVGGGVVSGVSAVGGGIASGAARAGGGIAYGVTRVGQEVADGIQAVGEGIGTGSRKVGEGIASGLSYVGSGIADGVAKAGAGLADGVAGAGRGIRHGAEKIVTDTSSVIQATGKVAKKAGTGALDKVTGLAKATGNSVTTPFRRGKTGKNKKKNVPEA